MEMLALHQYRARRYRGVYVPKIRKGKSLEVNASTCSGPALSFLCSKAKQSKTLCLAKARTVQLFAWGTGEQASPPGSIPAFVLLVCYTWPRDVK